jgi:LPXTG-motif cell wall-anchored protein
MKSAGADFIEGQNMWLIIMMVLFAAALAYGVFRKKKPDTPPHDTYVCDVCNERECICHKQEDKP